MAYYEIEVEHYNRNSERIDIHTQGDRIKKIISDLIKNALKN